MAIETHKNCGICKKSFLLKVKCSLPSLLTFMLDELLERRKSTFFKDACVDCIEGAFVAKNVYTSKK